jgi:hypothetical protein
VVRLKASPHKASLHHVSAHKVRRDYRFPVLLCRLSSRRYLCWAVLALAMIVGRVALLPLLPPPEPSIHDEFSNLLAGDTFAHGRVANPTPPHPEFFESPHILLRPAYASIYPPGQGLMLALGRKLLGHPYWGVALTGALMIFLFCWMSDAWLPPQWALIAGGLSVVLFFVRHYWFDSYWGGSLAACGGALVVGGFGRILRGQSKQAGVTLALGAMLLFCTRPYEGGLLCAGVLIVLAIRWWRITSQNRRSLLRFVFLPSAAVLLVAVPLLAWYDLRITGNAAELPYLFYVSHYDRSPKLWILPPLPPVKYDSAILQRVHDWEVGPYERLRQMPISQALSQQFLLFLLAGVWIQFLAFGFLLLGVPWIALRKQWRWLLIVLGVGLIGALLETFALPHYTAPFTPVLLLLIVAVGRTFWYRLATVRWGGAVFTVAAAVMLIFILFDYERVLITPRGTGRSRLIQQLEAKGGRHLVLVDYAPGWDPIQPDAEWVYNGADLNASRILFAHLRPEHENRELLEEYKDRDAWLVRLGPQPSEMHLERYQEHP